MRRMGEDAPKAAFALLTVTQVGRINDEQLSGRKAGVVSDVGIVFPWWFILGVALMIALPVTTAIMVGLGVAASRARRRGHARRLAGLKWSASIVAPFWLLGLAFGGWYVVSEIRERIYEARHYFTLDKAREVDGIAFPAGTWVALDGTRPSRRPSCRPARR